MDLPVLPPGDRKEIRGQNTWGNPIEPGRAPEGGFQPVANGDPGGCIEEGFVGAVIWRFGAHPWLVRRNPFVPQPSQPQRSRELLEMQNTQPTESLRAADLVLTDLAFPATDLLTTVPQHDTSDFVESLEDALVGLPNCYVFDDLQTDHHCYCC